MNNDVVTAVETSKKGALVTVNHGQEVLYISRENWLERRFAEGDEIDLEELHQWLLPRQYPEALNYAVSLLALRGRSTGELRKKLLERHYMDDTADMVIYKLEKERFVDDEAFARDYAAQLSRRKLGKKRILMELRHKGIPQDMAEEAIAALDEEETADGAVELARKLLKKYSREEDARKAMQKLLAAMARRGYGFDEARQAVETAMASLEEEE
ncbi:MAG: regulatory protein RecX [Clostridia bacterium]|nr:regulatory protein RecX [Clostridia bacterium]